MRFGEDEILMKNDASFNVLSPYYIKDCGQFLVLNQGSRTNNFREIQLIVRHHTPYAKRFFCLALSLIMLQSSLMVLYCQKFEVEQNQQNLIVFETKSKWWHLSS